MEHLFEVMLSTSLRSGRRAAGHGEEVSGSLLIGELDTQARTLQVGRQVELPESPHLPGRRSVRGIAEFADGIAACNTSQVFLFDRDLTRIQRSFSDERLGDLHSISARNGELFVTATASDCIVAVDGGLRKTSEWWAGSEEALQPYMRDWQRRRFKANHDFRRDLNPGARFHMNHVCFDPNGDMLVNLPGMSYREGKSRVFNVTRREFLFGGQPIPDAIRGRIHDGIATVSHYYLCRTATGDYVKLDRQTGRVEGCVNCSVPLGATTGDPIAVEHGWLRGATLLRDELFLVGQSRLTLFLVDMRRQSRQSVRVMAADGDLHDHGLSIYCIERLRSG